MQTEVSFIDHLFAVLSENKDHVPISSFVEGLEEVGFQENDPRLHDLFDKIRSAGGLRSLKDVVLNKKLFHECLSSLPAIVKKAFTEDLVIPEFSTFTEVIQDIYEECTKNNTGKLASYIPQLARVSPTYWGVSLCTIDGQRKSFGDTDVPFCLQSTSKPLTYALALNEHGSAFVHDHVGREPSGEAFNVIKLDQNNKPHNPMINAGAIITASLVKNHLPLADRFDYALEHFREFAGGEYLGFNNAVYLSERDTADRNFALAYYMKENKCFPPGADLQKTLDFYFQLCSIEVTCESASVIAATLANGGICPITGQDVLHSEAVRNTLSLMHSCGMYDYSGQFAFKVGLPSKSGVSGIILLVIPNVMGMCLWSPPLDLIGNSSRGLQFAEELVRRFNFHHYDNLIHTKQKKDPRKRELDSVADRIVSLMFGAYNGDLSALTRMYLGGADMDVADYDGRTPLHLAAAEGHLECVRFLLETCKVSHNPEDRWGNQPIDDAFTFQRNDVHDYLRAYTARREKAKKGDSAVLSPATDQHISHQPVLDHNEQSSEGEEETGDQGMSLPEEVKQKLILAASQKGSVNGSINGSINGSFTVGENGLLHNGPNSGWQGNGMWTVVVDSDDGGSEKGDS